MHEDIRQLRILHRVPRRALLPRRQVVPGGGGHLQHSENHHRGHGLRPHAEPRIAAQPGKNQGMRPYFEKMASFGKELRENRIARTQDSRAKLEAVEAAIVAARKAREEAGIPAATINARGMLTVWQRLEYLVDPGTWHPLHSLYNPAGNAEGRTHRLDGPG